MPTPPADGSDEDCRPAEERDAVSVDEESRTVRDACSGMDADAEASTRAGRAVDSMMLTGAVGLTAFQPSKIPACDNGIASILS